jgi:predicted O-linked N-acetylglucosamine transferase (SPINDLY family)
MTAEIVPDEAILAAHHLEAGNPVLALACAERALHAPPSPAAFGLAAAAHAALGDRDRAIRRYRDGLAAFPRHAALTINFARLLREAPDGVAEAVARLETLAASEPDFAPALLCLIETLRTAARRPRAAEAAARDYVQRFPDDGGGHLALALALFDQGRLADATAAADAATRLPGRSAPRAWELMGNLSVDLGDPEGAADAYRTLLRLAPDPDSHSRLLMAMQYCETASEAEIRAETGRWARGYDQDVMPRAAWPDLAFEPERRLSVGIVSGDFRQCSTPLLALPLFDHWPTDWDVTLYANNDQADGWTARFRRTADRWIDIVAFDDDQVAARIAADRIDVLIDLNGHTLGGRLGVFRRKPAPVQVAWLDYTGSTGLATFDAIIGDAGHLPLSDQPLYAEPIHHVVDNLYRYLPPDDAPPIGPLPALANGFVTFGCFNAPYKLSASTLTRWAAILEALPTARLVLNSRNYQYSDTARRFHRLLAERGVASDRVECRPGAQSPQGMMAAYRDIDVALDPFPYSGGLTTIEALYMGVPVVTMPGGRFCSRHSAVHLRTVGLGDWIADDHAAYIDCAVRKALAPDALAALRSGLRARVEGSALLDGPGLAGDFGRLIRVLWRSACARRGALMRRTRPPPL